VDKHRSYHPITTQGKKFTQLVTSPPSQAIKSALQLTASITVSAPEVILEKEENKSMTEIMLIRGRRRMHLMCVRDLMKAVQGR
jgi:hypothetical protein